ncbi:hypothetical protein Dimus_025744 [Dionaea muscipula]
MDGPSVNSATNPTYNDEKRRVKFLCSFSGSILPRPQDGKLRYVGGETRILCVPRDIRFDDLMARMRDLYGGASILKYQQPEEDLDALVSVVNDDDVTHMMEEHDKLGSRDGFPRLRIFLFLHPDQDLSPHYIDGGERDNERRYVDALNSLNEPPDYRRQQYNESPIKTPPEELYVADQFNSINIEGGFPTWRNFEIPVPQYNLQHLPIPNVASGQHALPITQRYNEEASWSSAYCSPQYASPNDPQAISEVQSSPSSAQYRPPFVEVPDKGVDRTTEEYGRPQVNRQPSYDYQSQYSDNFVWLLSGKGGFPGNVLHGPSGFDGDRICGSCRMVFQRNHSATDFKWKHEEQSHMEQSSLANGFPHIGNSCVECQPTREAVSWSTDLKLHQGGYNEHIDPRLHYGETHTSEKGWGLQHQLNSRADEQTAHIPGAGRANDNYVIASSSVGFPVGHAISDGRSVPLNYIHLDDPRYIRSGHELGNDVFRGQAVAAGPHIHIPFEERGARRANLLYNSCQPSHAHLPAQNLWANVPPPHLHSPRDISTLQQRNGTNVPGLPRINYEDSPRCSAGLDQTAPVESPQWTGIDGTARLDYLCGHVPNTHHGVVSQETHAVPQNCNQSQPKKLNTASLLPVTSTTVGNSCGPSGSTGVLMFDDRALHGDKSTNWGQLESSILPSIHDQAVNGTVDSGPILVSIEVPQVSCVRPAEGCKGTTDLDGEGHTITAQDDDIDLSFLPELVASAKQTKLESIEVMKAIAQEDSCAATDPSAKNFYAGESSSTNAHRNPECEHDNDNPPSSKIEPTKAEEEAFAKGLQTIKNDDLEEVKELGSGTYGSVYHGKWKGSDVAIKRIKSSCFAGRPSERERLIADFWKEALILSSLHHPNVVSFYGVVRDSPDGSLATVTEFMVNGSLKHYLQKKDRTIDRRKRLLIAMDAAFGMEYLHEKNIVHFDLKCENLLVNMRDPHRPVCKIGDLGLSKVRHHTLVSGGVRGTLPWMAPELLSGKSNMVSEKIDVYSFGIVMWELLTGDEPYADLCCASVIGRLLL